MISSRAQLRSVEAGREVASGIPCVLSCAGCIQLLCHIRYLKDLNNQFHGGGSINFVEMISGVSEVDEDTSLQCVHTGCAVVCKYGFK